MEDEKSRSMWETFEHVLLFISMYIFVTSITLLFHSFIDVWSPKTSDYPSFPSTVSVILIGYVSSIVVSYPLFTYLFLHITRKTLKNPELRKNRARKAMIYLTLIATFIIGVANLISIVYNFLNGNVTLNFALHFLLSFGVCAFIYLYYLGQVKDNHQSYA